MKKKRDFCPWRAVATMPDDNTVKVVHSFWFKEAAQRWLGAYAFRGYATQLYFYRWRLW